MNKLLRNVIIIFILLVTVTVVCIGLSTDNKTVTVEQNVHVQNSENNSEEETSEVSSEYSDTLDNDSTIFDTESYYIERDPLYNSADYKADIDTPMVESDLDVSAFDTEQSKNVVRELALSLNQKSVEMFHRFTDYDAGILTTTYYITFDENTVYYVFEQGTNSYILRDDNNDYATVVEMLKVDTQ